jgi:hypothetical protein
MADLTPSLLVVDDQEDLLNQLIAELRGLLPDAKIIGWKPAKQDDPRARFDELIEDRTVLVVADQDLTGAGLTGFFGASIVSWCQTRGIPVGDFSRGKVGQLPGQPNLFELRVPPDVPQGSQYVAAIFNGFEDLRALVLENPEFLSGTRSPSQALSIVLGRPDLESQLSLYVAPVASANPSLIQRLRGTVEDDVGSEEKARILVYILGHLLFNAVLRYPGPILSQEALSAYLGTTPAEASALNDVFASATYSGPFSGEEIFYWRDKVDEAIDSLVPATLMETEFKTIGSFHREVIKESIGRDLQRHGCDRCDGVEGGFWCPFTERPVCELSECSVGANSWIVPGASLCRIERDFYDEWAPFVGL